jgi:hypothetical protein
MSARAIARASATGVVIQEHAVSEYKETAADSATRDSARLTKAVEQRDLRRHGACKRPIRRTTRLTPRRIGTVDQCREESSRGRSPVAQAHWPDIGQDLTRH